MLVRDATTEDVAAIAALYNATVLTTTVAWTEQEQSVEDRAAWFARQLVDGFPVLVARTEASGGRPEVVGFASYGHFRGAGVWPGYRFTVEHTIHVREDQWGTGVGRALLRELIVRARVGGKHVMVGAIDGANAASIAFHARLGFVEVARMPQVGYKFGRWLDLVLMQRIVDPDERAAST